VAANRPARARLLALDALVAAGHRPDGWRRAARAYLFLRRLENRLQMLRDAQTHACRRTQRPPRWRGLGFADWDALLHALDAQRARVSRIRRAAGAAPAAAAPDALANGWRARAGRRRQALLAGAGFARCRRRPRCAVSPRVRRARAVRCGACAAGSGAAGAADAVAHSPQPDAALGPCSACCRRSCAAPAIWRCWTNSPRAGAAGRRAGAQRAAGRAPGRAPAAAGRTAGHPRGGPMPDRERLHAAIAAVGQGEDVEPRCARSTKRAWR
jgi:hypothetical protein